MIEKLKNTSSAQLWAAHLITCCLDGGNVRAGVEHLVHDWAVVLSCGVELFRFNPFLPEVQNS